MAARPRDPLLDAARALTDGRDVEWDKLVSAHPEKARKLRQLRVLHSIARACAAPIEDLEPPLGGGAGESVSGDGRDRQLEAGTEPGAAGLPPTWGALRILEKVGSGGFGDVFRAFDPMLHREVALKLRRFSDEDEATAFEVHLQEARLLARVRHPNVLAVHGVEIHDGRAGLWTDFVTGETLEERARRVGPLAPGEIARIGGDGARWVDLAGLADTAGTAPDRDGESMLVAETVACAVDVPPSKRQTALERLIEHVRNRSGLLVLDPPPGQDDLAILDWEAVRLFLDRACRQVPGFVVSPQIAPAVARIVRRLDGIPLAIELAAARVGALSVEQIARRHVPSRRPRRPRSGAARSSPQPASSGRSVICKPLPAWRARPCRSCANRGIASGRRTA